MNTQTFSTSDLKIAALCRATGATLEGITPDPLTGRLSFEFSGIR
jgi:hypothetical protein